MKNVQDQRPLNSSGIHVATADFLDFSPLAKMAARI
jgi:hypothetical protein